MSQTAIQSTRTQVSKPPKSDSPATTERISTIVVGRRPDQVQALRTIVSELDTLSVVGCADSSQAAADLVRRHRPDLIVLDSGAPVEMVLEILDAGKETSRMVLGSVLCGVGFRAFEVCSRSTLLGTVHDIQARATILLGTEPQGVGSGGKRYGVDDPVILHLNDRFHIVRVKSILLVLAARHYSYVATQEGYKGIDTRSMKEWEDRLPHSSFARVHRNTIINLDYVERIESSDHSTHRVFLRGIEKPVTMSMRCFARIRRELE